MIYRVINAKTTGLQSIHEDFADAKTNCDAAAKREGVPFIVEKAETVWSSETLDKLLKETA